MNKKDLDILLNKFYSGETTLDEEELLRKALAGDDADALLMQALDNMEDEVVVPADLESSLSDKIDEWDAKEVRKAKVVPGFWKRTAWIAAASVAVIAVIGWWLMREPAKESVNNSTQIIAQADDVSPQDKTIDNANVLEPKEQLPQQAQVATNVSSAPTRVKAARVYKPRDVARQSSQLAQNTSIEETISAADEQLALEALEKFSTVINKGMDQLNDADETIENINNTIKQHLI